MRPVLLLLTACVLLAGFALAEVNQSRLTLIKHHTHHREKHHAHRATKHHAQHRHHNSV